MKRNELNIVVARAVVDGTVQLQSEAPERVEAVAGQRIAVKFPFRLAEATRRRERWRFAFTASLGSQRDQRVHGEWRDRPFLYDERWVALQIPLVAEPGQVLRYELHVQYHVGPWAGTDVDEVVSEKVEGEVQVVAPAA